MSLHVSCAFFLWEALCYESFLVSHDGAIYCILGLVDPHRRHYEIPIRSRHCILDTILLELVFFYHSLLPFLLVYFFISGRLCINDVTQQCHITRVCLRPLSFFGSIVILFFILDYFSCPRWYSSLKVNSCKALSFTMVPLTREALGSSSELLLLLLWNDLQVKFSCMIRNIS